MLKKILPLLLFLITISTSAFSQSSNETITVFLDCRGCDERFIQTEIGFVSFVRDQADAEVHIFIVRQFTGSGGQEYTIEFIGQGELDDQQEILTFVSPESDTEEERRNKLVSHIKLGLVGYLVDTNIFGRLSVSFDQNLIIEPTEAPENDPWNRWLFEVGGNTNFNGEESRKFLNLNGYTRARRITENWKTDFRYRHNYNRRTFVTTEEQEIAPGDTADVEVTEVFTVESQNLFGLVAKSLGPHWSAGFYTSVRSSTQDNIDFRFGIAPTIEYSLFPYSEFTRREVTFRYGITMAALNYTETTIFGETEELLFQQELNINTEFTQPWGGIEGGISAETYLHDFSKNNLRFDAEINMRVFRGLSVFISGRYSLINDQLSLPAGDSSDEDVLLNLRNQATSYSFGGSIGLEFTFGSIYNNVINPRL
ncbi:MAG: hypothetical protein JJ971_08065 [Balneolaceae bacterium]|nr:hypothetical protein [Balneolaceae bacterium]MBO6546808.1 hypothetical protein [Balneolaceae bacterium]MBO6649168.1 hypothetical protein [Balneolaceae bacterium]